VLPFLQKTFSFSVVLSLIMQPMAAPILLGAFAFSVPTKVVAQETEPTEEPAPAPEEEATPKEEEVVPEETPAEEVAPAAEVAPVTPEETPAISEPSEEVIPSSNENNDSEQATAEEDKKAVEEGSSQDSLDGEICTSTEQVTKTKDADWDISDDGKKAETKENVKLGVEYAFPDNKDVTVTFKCLPADESKLAHLKIEQINVEDIKLPQGMVSASPYAYDITTDGMKNGDFKYNLSLPKEDGKNVGIAYIEKEADEIKGKNLERGDLKSVEKKNISNDKDSVEASNLDHFTVFVSFKKDEVEHVPVTLCHATPPDTAANGYNEITTDDDGALNGHNDQHDADIIPPFNYYGGSFPGKNWTTEGEAILKNKCVAQGGLKAIKIVDDQSLLTQWSFQLDNGVPIQANSSGEVDFGQVSLGQHTVTESGPSGYNLSQVTNCTQVENTLSAVATVSAGGTTVCTFSNAVSKGSITVIKDAQPDSTQDFSFTITGHEQGVFMLDDDGDNQNQLSNTKSFQNLFPGEYSISEEEVASWQLETLSCDNGEASLGLKEGNTVSFNLHSGEHITCTFTNVQKPGILHVKKVIENGNLGSKQFQDFSFQVNDGETTAFDAVDGQNDMEVPAGGTYTVTEVAAPGYETSYDNCTNLTIPALEEETCTITNRINPVHVVATKIVCTNEADLPNYGEGGPDITATTAADWVETHKSCSLAPDWQFQWSYDGTPHQGDNVALGGAGWTTSDFTNGSGQVTMDIPNSDNSPKLWFREVYKDNFIPFTFNLPGGENNANPVSAEIYCHNDVVNYDNWDWVGNPQNGNTYYCVAWNAPKKGEIIIEKQTDPDGSQDEFSFSPSWGENFSLADNDSLSFDLAPGTYSVEELPQADWRLESVVCDDQSSPNAIKVESDKTVRCVFKNQEVAKIVATKIVCTDEADLPNYGEIGGPDITKTTAIDWVNTHESCSFKSDWQFQWSYYSTNNPGDNTGESVSSDWHTFGPTGINGETSADVDLKSSSLVWVREVWNDNYIPFTYGQDSENPNSNDVSAEIYCHNDVVNYDNYDFIDASDDNLTYYCVAWNAPKKGTLRVVKNLVNDSGQQKGVQDFSFQIDGAEAMAFNEDGINEIEVTPGTYNVTEVADSLYDTTYQSGESNNCSEVVVPSGGVGICTITNNDKPPVHVVATKIVCTNEADLPNYGEGGPDITATTAADWVETHKSCSLAPDWQFQWSYDGTPHQGDNVALGGAGWTTSDFTNGSGQVTMDIPNSDNSPKLWFREVYKDNFIPFTFNLPGGENNANPVSAEIYCHNDVVNYDNWDWVGNPQNGNTYYCVAWNVAKTGTITGYKFSDADGNGKQDEGEPGLAGWTLYLDLNNNGSLDEGEPSGVTGEDGTYTFTDLIPGNYVVREVLQEGWEQTLNTCGTQIEEIPTDNNELQLNRLIAVDVPGTTLEPGEEINCTFGNHNITPVLRLTKSVDVIDTQAPGDFVIYTLTVEAEENTVLDTEVTDLPPKGFEYVPGSAEATSSLGGSHDGPLELSHEYASPGVWSVGNLVPGETVTLKYQARISDSQDDGLYEDLAYARGNAQGGGDVLANDPTGFVGTQVAVATPVVDPIANIDTDNKKEIDRDTERKTRVLGASTGLPATGANSWILLLAFVLLCGGASLLWSRRTSMRVLFLGALLAGAAFLGSHQVMAAGPGLALEIETPDAFVTSPNFKIGFVALDTEGRAVTVRCYETTGGLFETIPLINGGSSGDCQVNSSVMSTDGNYSFYVTAEVEGDSPIQSGTVNVTFDGTFPGTPYNYDRDEATCDDKITFTTANDGQTVKVELYRSTAKDFVADTPITTLDIGPNQNGYISTTPPDCNEDYWYALRALDTNGNASGFVADRAVNTDTIHKTKTKTTTVSGQSGNGTGGGAIPVAGGGTGEGQGSTVEGATTEGAGDQGVLGEMTKDESQDQAGISNWAQNNKGSIFLILLIIGGILYYFFYVRPKSILTKND